jgi:hypothetical protein
MSRVFAMMCLVFFAGAASASTQPKKQTDREIFAQAETVAMVRFTGRSVTALSTNNYGILPDGTVGRVTIVLTRHEVELEKIIGGRSVPARFFVHIVGGEAKVPAAGKSVVLPLHVDLSRLDGSPEEGGYVILHNRMFPSGQLASLEKQISAARREK